MHSLDGQMEVRVEAAARLGLCQLDGYAMKWRSGRYLFAVTQVRGVLYAKSTDETILVSRAAMFLARYCGVCLSGCRTDYLTFCQGQRQCQHKPGPGYDDGGTVPIRQSPFAASSARHRVRLRRDTHHDSADEAARNIRV